MAGFACRTGCVVLDNRRIPNGPLRGPDHDSHADQCGGRDKPCPQLEQTPARMPVSCFCYTWTRWVEYERRLARLKAAAQLMQTVVQRPEGRQFRSTFGTGFRVRPQTVAL